MRTEIPFIGGAYAGRSATLNASQCINLYVEGDPTSAKSKVSLVGTPGLKAFGTSATGEGRGAIRYNNKIYGVVGNTLYEWTSSGGAGTSKGTLSTSTGRVSMAHNGPANGQQIMIVDGANGYIYDSGADTFNAISDPDFPGADTVTFQDGYFVFNEPDTGKAWATDSYDGTSIDALSFATAERDPDNIVAIISSRREVFLAGEITTEAWYNDGISSGLPFVPHQAGISQQGCLAAHSLKEFNGSLCMLGRADNGELGVVRLSQGYVWQIASPPSINYQIAQYATKSDAYANVFRMEGNEFYVLTFPTENVSWAMNAANGEWFQWASDLGGSFPERWRVAATVYAFGKVYGLDTSNGKLHEIDHDTYTEQGTAITRRRRGQHLNQQDSRLTCHYFEARVEAGNGTDTATLSVSRDNGSTFTSKGTQSFGSSTTARQKWNRLGQARDFVFSWETTTDQKVVLFGAVADLVIDDE